MLFAISLIASLAPTNIVDDPFESSVIYITPVAPNEKDAEIVYSDATSCSFLQVSDKNWVSSRKRGTKTASSFLEFKLTSIRRAVCSDPMGALDMSQARFFGGMEADVDVKEISQNCAITICKGEFSVSVRMTSGMSTVNEQVALKFGAPHAQSVTITLPLKSYLEHRADVLR